MRIQQYLSMQSSSDCDFIKEIFQIDQDCSRLLKYPQDRYRFVTAIYIINCHINLPAIRIIRNAEFKFIKNLDISHNIIDALSCNVLSQCHWIYLQKLNVSHNVIKNKGLAFLMKSQWPELRQLKIGYNNITDDGIANLLKCKCLRIQYIQICNQYCSTNQSFRYLWRLDFKNMRYVQLYQYPELLEQFAEFYSLNQLSKFKRTNKRLTIEVLFTMYSRKAAALLKKNENLLFQCDLSQQYF